MYIIVGNTESLKESVINEIEQLYDLEPDKSEFLPEELALRLAVLTCKINREIAVFINRKGNIIDISVGDNATVSLPEIRTRRDESRLVGVRCVHTHPNGISELSDIDINALLNLRLDAMVALGVSNNRVNGICVAIPARDRDGIISGADLFGPYKPGDPELNKFMEMITERDEAGGSILHSNQAQAERAILVGLYDSSSKGRNGRDEGTRSLDELEELAVTAGASVLRKVLQKRDSRDAAYYIGKGKIEELGLLCQALNANLIIFDDELSGAQVRNIEGVTGVRVIDRTTLILDIFAQRARSREGKLQVELAQLKYRLPRLAGLGSQLSRLGGGIGTRGPGEKKLDVDRRHIRRRISFLESELKNLSKRRNLARNSRKRNSIPTVALIGYTNVGKSTLMNRLCGADVFVENKLFATLDPTVRKLVLPDGRDALLIDTVGFIRKLPHDLIEAFKSTLEEAVYADVLIHVVDASSEELDTQVRVVNEILDSMGALNKPRIIALNKIDLVDSRDRLPVSLPGVKCFEISALTGMGIDQLLQGISSLIPVTEVELEIMAPYTEGWILSYIYDNGRILEAEYKDSGMRIKTVMDRIKAERIIEYAK